MHPFICNRMSVQLPEFKLSEVCISQTFFYEVSLYFSLLHNYIVAFMHVACLNLYEDNVYL